jgi:spore coat polysaccharide biosynthesis protein SpsF (cytidylyltransferase family)
VHQPDIVQVPFISAMTAEEFLTSCTCVITARMNSSRLPGKVLMKLYNDSTILDVLLAKIRTLDFVKTVILSISDSPIDDILQDWAKTNDVLYTRGPEHDVLYRLSQSAALSPSDDIIYLLGDSPLIPASHIAQTYRLHTSSHASYTTLYTREVSRVVQTDEPPLPSGTRVQVIKSELINIAESASRGNLYLREHASEFFVQNISHLNSCIIPRSMLKLDSPLSHFLKAEKLNLPFAVNTHNELREIKDFLVRESIDPVYID